MCAQARSPIWLVGMMGSGKSTVGPLLAQLLGRPFIDTDAWVETAAGQKIASIFETQGEAAFRRLEAQAIEETGRSEAVVALGGGAIAEPGMADRLGECGTVVYLRATPERLCARIRHPEKRPLLAGCDASTRLARLRELLAEREPAYLAAQVVVETGPGSASGVAEEIARRLAEERS